MEQSFEEQPLEDFVIEQAAKSLGHSISIINAFRDTKNHIDKFAKVLEKQITDFQSEDMMDVVKKVMEIKYQNRKNKSERIAEVKRKAKQLIEKTPHVNDDSYDLSDNDEQLVKSEDGDHIETILSIDEDGVVVGEYFQAEEVDVVHFDFDQLEDAVLQKVLEFIDNKLKQ